ncbi:MAG: hypothetical protein QGG36_06685 [Pirellulaceae bacterium]|nr:hypothetical protein [Pirellulaceae bacterium]
MRQPLQIFAISFIVVCASQASLSAQQYKHGDLVIPSASSDEAKLDKLSVDKATSYLEGGGSAWNKERKCIACHTNGTYLQLRPSLTSVLGKPSDEMRQFFVSRLAAHQETFEKKPEDLKRGIRPTQIAYIAQGLAEWDAHVSKKLSAETKQALELMLALQSDDGSWGNTDCWPPFESSDYQGATIAAMALAAAPEFLSKADEKQQAAVEKLKKYFRETKPANEYMNVLLLWTATRMPDLLTDAKRTELIEQLFSKQQADGGWAIRQFAEPEQWGRGNRAKKLRDEKGFDSPASDGHMTGLAIMVLRDAGAPATDARIKKGVAWLKTNQRVSGRWWTRSLNTDSFHFITYSGTLYALAALQKCDELK